MTGTDPARREFLTTAGIGVAALAVGRTVTVRAADKDRVTVGIIGPGGMGMNHVRLLAARKDVRIAWVCEVDANRSASAVEHIEKASGAKPQATTDMRKVLDDASVDAVFIATPDHWHAPAAIMALNAGKHVYVEKPCCHNIREGRLMAEAVARTGKLLQVGTQARSTEMVQEAVERVHSGEIGDVLVAKAWNSQRRRSIGKTQPSAPPAYLDFETWLGPAPEAEYRSNMLPGIWRWWYDYGCGDIGNDGVHEIDIAAWGLNPETSPNRVACLGGKYVFNDDQQFPDTQYSVCEYQEKQPKQLVFEQRIWSPYVQEGYENGVAFYGTEGYLTIGKGVGYRVYDGNKLTAERSGSVDLPAHHDNFLAGVRGETTKMNADIAAGRAAATVVHLSNISARVGRVLNFDPESDVIIDDAEANELIGRRYRENHWSVPTA